MAAQRAFRRATHWAVRWDNWTVDQTAGLTVLSMVPRWAVKTGSMMAVRWVAMTVALKAALSVVESADMSAAWMGTLMVQSLVDQMGEHWVAWWDLPTELYWAVRLVAWKASRLVTLMVAMTVAQTVHSMAERLACLTADTLALCWAASTDRLTAPLTAGLMVLPTAGMKAHHLAVSSELLWVGHWA